MADDSTLVGLQDLSLNIVHTALVFSRSPITFGASVIRCREGDVLRFLVLLPT